MLKNIFIFLSTLLLIIFMSLSTIAKQQITIVYPPEASKIDSQSTFFIGNTNPGSTLTINKKPVKIEKDGIFVTVVPLKPGKNTFNLKSAKNKDAAVKSINIKVPVQEGSLPSNSAIVDTDSIQPCGNSIYSPGDIVNFRVKGSPGSKVSLSLGNKTIPMIELPPTADNVKKYVLGSIYGQPDKAKSGIFNAVYKVQKTDICTEVPLKVNVSAKGKSKTIATSSKISVWDNSNVPRVGEITIDNAVVRTGPGDSRQTPLPRGVRLYITGLENGYYRFKMGPLLDGYILQSSVKLQPKGTPLPYSEIRNINTKMTEGELLIFIPMSDKLPYKIEQSTDQQKLNIYFYGAKADTDIIKYDYKDRYIYQMSYTQPNKEVYNLEILFSKKQQWGYDASYIGDSKNGNINFFLKIKYPPKINKESPLKGKIIVLDPGHGGTEKGSVGPGLVPEKDINLKIAQKLANLLENDGAKALLTRTTDKDLSLYARTDFAGDNKGDILISLHNNALPDGRNPLTEHGSSAYYYHPMAFDLALCIHKQLLKDLKLPDFGFYYDNLALTREYRMPSALIEVAFMINPGEYHKLITPEFQQDSAEAIYKGIKEFFLSKR